MIRTGIVCPIDPLPYNGDPLSLRKVLPLMSKHSFCKSVVHSIQLECRTCSRAVSLYIRGIGSLVRHFVFMVSHIHAWRMCGFCCGVTSRTFRAPRSLKLILTQRFNFSCIGKRLEPIFHINFLLFFLGVPSREKLVQARRLAPSTQIITSQHKGL